MYVCVCVCAVQPLSTFQLDWRNVLMDNDLSEDISEVCKHSDVSALIEALHKRHPQHPNITGTKAALRAVSQHSDGEFDTEGSRSFVLCPNLGVVGPPIPPFLNQEVWRTTEVCEFVMACV